MKTGTKIIATNTIYPECVPNGTVMTVFKHLDDGYVLATVDGGNSFDWAMREGTFEEYAIPYGHVTLSDGRTVDLTAERQYQCSMMDPEELQAMKDHGGPYEFWFQTSWTTALTPTWADHRTYRVAPKPVVETVVLTGSSELDWIFSDVPISDDTHKITLTIQDGDIIDTKAEKL